MKSEAAASFRGMCQPSGISTGLEVSNSVQAAHAANHSTTKAQNQMPDTECAINWNISNADFSLVVKIADRTLALIPDYPDDRRTLIMDIHACHCNGCPLDLTGLLAADKNEFVCEIAGIRKAINRRTGKLTDDAYMPRYAVAQGQIQ
jgi:hypothetical protein